MGDDFTFNIGDTLTKLGAQYFDYRLAQATQAVRWVPGAGNGPTYGLGADGTLYTRGAPAAGTPLAASGMSGSLVMVGLLLVAGLVAYRALR